MSTTIHNNANTYDLLPDTKAQKQEIVQINTHIINNIKLRKVVLYHHSHLNMNRLFLYFFNVHNRSAFK